MSPRPADPRAVERIRRVCDAPHEDDRALRAALLDEIGRFVGFDASAWLLTDPESEVGCAPLADVPCLPELPRLVRLKYLTAVNRWTGLDRPAAGLRSATGDDRASSLVWREMLDHHDVSDVASLVFRDRFGCWGFLDLWRTGSGARYEEAELDTLAAIAGPVTEALRRAQAQTFASPVPTHERGGPAVLVLSSDLVVRGQTPPTDDYLRHLLPPNDGGAPVPAGAYNVAAQLLAVEAGVDDHPPVARVHLAEGIWLTFRAAWIGDGGPTERGSIAVSIELASPAERTSVFARASGLSAREAELFDHLAAGSDTRQVARQMVVSEHTIQDHLKSIFAKTGAPNRRTLLARAVGR